MRGHSLSSRDSLAGGVESAIVTLSVTHLTLTRDAPMVRLCCDPAAFIVSAKRQSKILSNGK